MDIKKHDITRVLFRSMEDVEPNQCFENAKMLAERHGGRSVYGWAVTDLKMLWRLIPHAIWEDAEGDWWEVTPFRSHSEWCDAELVACDRDFVEEHEPDPTHEFLPSKFVPKVPEAVDPCRYLHNAVSHSGDRHRATFWDGRARRFLARHGVDLRLAEFHDGSHDYLTSTPQHARPLGLAA